MPNDSLAQGARKATFMPPKVTQERWDAIFAELPEKIKEAASKEKGKVHAVNELVDYVNMSDVDIVPKKKRK